MRVETVIRFNDLEAQKIREEKEAFDTSTERAEKLMGLGFVKELTKTKQPEKTEKG